MTNTNTTIDEVMVIYRTGPFQWNKTFPGVLRWTKDNHIQFFILSSDGAQKKEFDVALKDIEKVSGALSYLTFHLKEKTYRLDLYSGSIPTRTFAAPADQVLRGFEKNQTSGAELWALLLKKDDVKVQYLNTKGFTILVLVAVAVTIALALALVLIFDQF